MSGKKDRHDLFIEQWMKQQRELAEEAKKQAEMKQKEFRAKLQDVDLTTVEGSRPISSVELKKILAKSKSIGRDSPATQYGPSFDGEDPKDRFLKKISARIIRPNEKG
jgi:hypothetical protein